MNKQRKVLITTTYNELGIIIDTKVEEVAQPNLPTADQDWIPCSERLPEEDGQYTVTVKYEHVDGYEDVYSEHGEWVDGHWDAGYGHCGRVEKVLAWMPLPEPYKGGDKDV